MELINYFNTSQLNIDINLYCCGVQQCVPNQTYGPSVREDHLIHLILSGQGILKINDSTYHLKEGQGFYIPANVTASYKPIKVDPWKYMWISFKGSKVDDYLALTNLSVDNPILEDSDGELKKIIKNIIDSSLEYTYSKDLLLLSYLYQFIFLLTENFPSSEISNDHINSTSYVEKALSYIELNYTCNLTINDVCDYLSLDKSYFHKIFKQHMKISPKQHLIDLRLKKACKLLNETNLSIGNISNSVGYNDVQLFSKTFKKHLGKSPSEYRKNLSYNPIIIKV